MSKLTVATSFPIFPPLGGGQRRIFDLYSEMARHGVAVDVVALAPDRPGVRELAPGLREIRVQRTSEHTAAERALERSVGDVPVTDIGLTLLHELTPGYADALAQSARDSAGVVVSHPYALPAVPDGVPVIYESHNVEADLKDAILPPGEVAEAARAVEAAACGRAELVLTCSLGDLKRLDELYGVAAMNALLVPNGVDPQRVAFTAPEERARLGEQLGTGFQALFVGSWHEPNLVAARDVIAAAAEAPELRFLLVGGAGLAFEREDDLPGNVDICGIVAEGFLASVLAVSSAALNPMRAGSGTNLKMLDYMLAGLPVISTRTGARGLDVEPGLHYVEAEPEQLAAALREVADADLAEMVDTARRHVLTSFAWPVIVGALLEDPRMRDLLDGVRV